MTAEPNDISTELSQKDPLTNDHENKYRLKAAAFLATVSGFGFLAGFGGALAAVKKQEPTSFDQGLALRTSKRVNIYFLNTIKSLQAPENDLLPPPLTTAPMFHQFSYIANFRLIRTDKTRQNFVVDPIFIN